MNKNIALKGRTVVVTGALGLLGLQFSHHIAKCGGIPILVDVDDDTSERYLSLPDYMKKNYYQLDITDERAIERFWHDIRFKFKEVNGLVNNAAINPKVEDENSHLQGFEGFNVADWNIESAVGLTGAILMTKYFGESVQLQGCSGAIVNISSDLGVIAPDQRLYSHGEEYGGKKPVGYSVIKHGIIGLTKYTATYWPCKIRCNALCPGGVENGQPSSFIEEVSSRIPLARMGRPFEYNAALEFLLSDASQYMTGQALIIDGGRTIW